MHSETRAPSRCCCASRSPDARRVFKAADRPGEGRKWSGDYRWSGGGAGEWREGLRAADVRAKVQRKAKVGKKPDGGNNTALRGLPEALRSERDTLFSLLSSTVTRPLSGSLELFGLCLAV